MKMVRRDKLRRLVEAGRVVMVGSYNFDDMHGESRQQGVAIPCAIRPKDWRDMKQGVCYLHEHDFKSGVGRAWENSNGTITLYVHSNSNYELRILPEAQ